MVNIANHLKISKRTCKKLFKTLEINTRGQFYIHKQRVKPDILNKHTKQELEKLYKTMNVKEIAKKLGYSYEIMRQVFIELGIQKTDYTLKFVQREIVTKYSKDDLMNLLKVRTTVELASYLDISYNTLIPILKYYKIHYENR